MKTKIGRVTIDHPEDMHVVYYDECKYIVGLDYNDHPPEIDDIKFRVGKKDAGTWHVNEVIDAIPQVLICPGCGRLIDRRGKAS